VSTGWEIPTIENIKDFTILFINSGADVNVKEIQTGFTPLHRAVIHLNDKDIVKILIDAGVNPFITDNKGRKTIDMTQNEDIITMLENYENMLNNTIESINNGAPFWEIVGASSITLPQWVLIKKLISEISPLEENENALEFFTQLPIELRELKHVTNITEQDDIKFIDALNLLRLKVYPDFDNENNDKIMNNIAYTLVKHNTNKKSLFEGLIEQGKDSFIDIESALMETGKPLFSDWRIDDETKMHLILEYFPEKLFK